MHQTPSRSLRPSVDAVQVVLVLDVPVEPAELHTRAAQLADEFGRLVSRSIPRVHARKAVVSVGGDPGRRPGSDPVRRRDGLFIDRASRDVRVDGRRVRLTYREFELLAYLAGCPRQAVSRAELMHKVWCDRAAASARDISDRTVDTHIRRLRAKLGEHARALTTVRGHGYRFDPGPDVHDVPGNTCRPA